MAQSMAPYPVTFSVDYPDRPLNKLTSFFRIFVSIPMLVVLAFIVGASFQWEGPDGWKWQFASGGYLALPVLLMLLFRQKYPRWWFDWNLALARLLARVNVYLLLLRDEYPSTDEEQAVHLEIPYPEAKQLNRWLPLVKWLLAIPHYFVLAFLAIAVLVCVVIAWFAILFTGVYPRGLFDFVVGFYRWELRVFSYAFLLVTDQYPPFQLTS